MSMFITLDEVDSTNDEARRQVAAGAAHGTVVWAKTQKAGRGRLGRPWISPRGNLYFSLIVEPERPLKDWSVFSLFSSCVLSSVISWTLDDPDELQFKWPNDILVNGRKVAGILLETVHDQNGAKLIIGCGVNIVSYPSETQFPATSLMEESAFDVDSYTLLCRFLSEYDVWWQLWERKGFALLKEEVERRLYGRGLAMTVDSGGEKPVTGLCEGLDESGFLCLRMKDGSLRVVNTGVLIPVRNAL